MAHPNEAGAAGPTPAGTGGPRPGDPAPGSGRDAAPAHQPGVREERRGAVAILTLDDAARRNVLSPPLKVALEAALGRALADPAVRAVVLTGAGGHFSGGGDLDSMRNLDLMVGRTRMEATHRLVRMLAASPRPVVAAVEGWCAGGSLGLMLCCDTVVAGEGARFLASFPKVGLAPDLGLTHSLPRRVGEGRARQMLLYAEPVSAPEALAMGLVDALAPTGGALEAAVLRAERLCEMAPLTLAHTRQRLWRGLEEALGWEADVQPALFLSEDHAEGKTAFFEKRAPRFVGR